MDVYMNDLRSFRNDIEELQSFRGRHRKVYKEKCNPMDLGDNEFKVKYRFSKDNMKRIIEILREDLQVDSRGGGISPELQVMSVIRYWGRHEVQEDCAAVHGLSQQTMSRLSKKLADVLVKRASEYIKMPMTPAEQSETIAKFSTISGFPQVIGLIDCTEVRIKKIGGENGLPFLNSNSQYSIKTQIVCDASLKICDIVCEWGGSTHDVKIFHESSVRTKFEENQFSGILLGDSSYPCTPYLLTPILRPQNESEVKYNASHISTRNIIEQCFGLWKQRFGILLEVMRESLETIKSIIIACAVLHNLAIDYDDVILDEDPLNNKHTCNDKMAVETEDNCNDYNNEQHKNTFVEAISYSLLEFGEDNPDCNYYNNLSRNIFIQNYFS